MTVMFSLLFTFLLNFRSIRRAESDHLVSADELIWTYRSFSFSIRLTTPSGPAFTHSGRCDESWRPDTGENKKQKTKKNLPREEVGRRNESPQHGVKGSFISPKLRCCRFFLELSPPGRVSDRISGSLVRIFAARRQNKTNGDG